MRNAPNTQFTQNTHAIFWKKINEYSTWYRSGKGYTNDSKGISKGDESHSYHIVIT